MVGPDTLVVRFDSAAGVLRVRVATDSLAFDLRSLAGTIADDSSTTRNSLPPERLRLQAAGPKRRAMLALESLNGRRVADSIRVDRWQGRLFLGKAR